MKPLMYLMVGGLILSGAAAEAAKRDRDYGRRGDVYSERYRDYGRDVRGDVRVVYSTGDVRIIREHYVPRYRNLPPGLRKKLARTGQLPPGWQRKVQPFPVVVERRLARLPRGYRRGVYDDRAVIVGPRGVLIDARVIF
jgi:hypothetical protein